MIDPLYRSYEQHLPLFYQSWWLDGVCGPGGWHAIVLTDGDENVRALWPFQWRRRYGFSLIQPPPLTPNLGPWLVYPEKLEKTHSRHDFEWRMIDALLDRLPRHQFAQVNGPYQLTNWLPFRQRGWQQTTRYSYRISLAQGLDTVWAGFAGKQRTAIRKAERELTVTTSEDISLLYELNRLSFAQRQVEFPIAYSLLERLDAALQKHGQGRLFFAHDREGRPHAALYLVWDRYSGYNLLQGSDPALRRSGAAGLLIWEAIQYTASRELAFFDFEGSQLPGVEPFFRSFGGEMQAYHQLTRAPFWLRSLQYLRKRL